MSERIGKHLLAEELSSRDHGRRFYIVNNRKQALGTVRYFPDWKQYVFAPVDGSEFERQCLTDLAAFLKGLGRK